MCLDISCCKKEDQNSILNQIIKNGFAKTKLPTFSGIEKIKFDLKNIAEEFSNKKVDELENIHRYVKQDRINEFRLKALTYLNAETNVKNELIDFVFPFLKKILGADLAVQKNLNLVLLSPEDPTSILPMHTDTWTGHSSFELVVLYSLFKTLPEQNMFVLPLNEYKKNAALFEQKLPLQVLTEKLKDSLVHLDLEPGDAVILWHAVPHGNKINRANTTHWSLNLRFKNIFTPYEQKRLGEYFQPLCLSPFNEFVYRESTGEKKNE